VSPTTTKALVEAGYKISVERSASRMFSDEEFVAAGATLVAEGSWPEAPIDNIIVGLKELPKDSCAYLYFYFSPSSALELVQVMNLADLPFLSSPGSLSHSIRSLLQRSGRLGRLPRPLRSRWWYPLGYRIPHRRLGEACLSIRVLRRLCWCCRLSISMGPPTTAPGDPMPIHTGLSIRQGARERRRECDSCR
jgi:Alanine dehydrogenase/PNT, N-terminal domain